MCCLYLFKMTYSDKLKSPKWQKKRLEILQRDEFKCCYCNDEKTELQIHHLKYTGNPWDAPGEDLITLCKHCHKYVSALKQARIIRVIKSRVNNDYVSLSIKEYLTGTDIIVISVVGYCLLTNEIEFLIALDPKGETLKSINNLTNG